MVKTCREQMGTRLAISPPRVCGDRHTALLAMARRAHEGEMRDTMPQDSDGDAPDIPTTPGTLGPDVPTPTPDPGIFTGPAMPVPTIPQTAPEVPSSPEFPGVTDPETRPQPPQPEIPDAPTEPGGPGAPEIPDPIIPQGPEEPNVPQPEI